MKYKLIPALLAYSLSSSASGQALYFQALTQTEIKLKSGETKSVVYKIKNQSPSAHRIEMRQIVGVTEKEGRRACQNIGTLQAGQSCILNLEIHGDKFLSPDDRAPRVCVDSSVDLCFTPIEAQLLRVKIL